MKKTVVLTALVLAIGAGIAFAHNNRRSIREILTGVKEVPVVSTTGSGTFRAEISRDGDEIEYTLSFRNLEGDVRQAHIHIAPEQNTGPIVLWLCQTAANVAPAGHQSAPVLQRPGRRLAAVQHRQRRASRL